MLVVKQIASLDFQIGAIVVKYTVVKQYKSGDCCTVHFGFAWKRLSDLHKKFELVYRVRL